MLSPSWSACRQASRNSPAPAAVEQDVVDDGDEVAGQEHPGRARDHHNLRAAEGRRQRHRQADGQDDEDDDEAPEQAVALAREPALCMQGARLSRVHCFW